MYHHNRARFMTPDPMGMKGPDPRKPQTLNRYAYVNNDPVNFVDPGGLFAGYFSCPEYSWLNGDSNYWNSAIICETTIPGLPTGSGWDINIGIGGGEQQPRTLPTRLTQNRLKQLLDDLYNKYKDRINQCIQRIFGDKASAAGEQTRTNAPSVNLTRNVEQLGGDGKVEANETAAGLRITMYLAHNISGFSYSQVTGGSIGLDTRVQRAYVHELGNYLAAKATNSINVYAFGNPNLIDHTGGKDGDTGNRLEQCVFQDKTSPDK
jgi:hypothetical protein